MFPDFVRGVVFYTRLVEFDAHVCVVSCREHFKLCHNQKEVVRRQTQKGVRCGYFRQSQYLRLR